MRQSIAPVMVALVLVTCAALPVSAQVIKVSPMSHDFGDMKQQETRTTTVTVTNEGAGLLKIEEVKADCGCTVPTLDNDSLAPGESTEIVIEFSSKKFNGPVRKGVRIHTNDPLNPTVDVMIAANVHTALLIDPVSQRLGMSQHLQGEAVSKRAIFTATGDGPLEIAADKSRKGLFDIKVINNLDGDPKQAALEVTAPKTMKAGEHRDNVRVTTNLPDFPTVDFEMKTTVVQELVLSPNRLTFRFKKEFSQSVRVGAFKKGTPFKVTRVECDLPELRVEAIETIPNVETLVQVKGQPIAKTDPRAIAAKGRISGTIKIHTDVDSTPVLEVPITYMVRM
jgi:hypothetical protein